MFTIAFNDKLWFWVSYGKRKKCEFRDLLLERVNFMVRIQIWYNNIHYDICDYRDVVFEVSCDLCSTI